MGSPRQQISEKWTFKICLKIAAPVLPGQSTNRTRYLLYCSPQRRLQLCCFVFRGFINYCSGVGGGGIKRRRNDYLTINIIRISKIQVIFISVTTREAHQCLHCDNHRIVGHNNCIVLVLSCLSVYQLIRKVHPLSLMYIYTFEK